MNKIKNNKLTIFCYSSVFIFILALCNSFIPAVDDFDFAGAINESTTIKDIITVWGVNGRYLGNIFGILFSYLSLNGYDFIRLIFEAFVLFFSYIFIVKIIKKTDSSYKICSVIFPLVYVCMSLWGGYAEPLGFSAGFMNYVLPMMFFLIVFYLIQDEININNNITNDGFGKLFLIFILSFIFSLFAEHITLFALFVLIVFLAFKLIKKQKSKKIISATAGSYFGTIFMFSHNILFSYPTEQTYRSTVFSGSILTEITDNIISNSYLFLFIHFLLMAVICITSVLLTIVFIDNIKRKHLPIIIICNILITLSFLISIISYFSFFKNPLIDIITGNLSKTIFTILCYLSFGLIIVLCFPKKKSKNYIYFFYLSNFVIVGELSLVNPIGSRCFYVCYLFICIVLTIIISEIFNKLNCKIRTIALILFSVISLLYFTYSANILYETKKQYNVCTEIIETEMKNGSTEIEIPEIDTLLGTRQNWTGFYYYNQCGDITINQNVPYSEWIIDR